jgi:hypothetical protein
MFTYLKIRVNKCEVLVNGFLALITRGNLSIEVI